MDKFESDGSTNAQKIRIMLDAPAGLSPNIKFSIHVFHFLFNKLQAATLNKMGKQLTVLIPALN